MLFRNGGLSGDHPQDIPSVNGSVSKINPARVVKCVIDLFIQPVSLLQGSFLRAGSRSIRY